MTSDETQIEVLLDSARLLERRLSVALANIRGISYSEYRLLKSLQDKHAGRATRVDLAAAVRLTPSAITRALMPLEKLGYVTTQKSARDARRSLAILTPAGERLLQDAQSVVDDVLRGLPLAQLRAAELVTFHEQLVLMGTSATTSAAVSDER